MAVLKVIFFSQQYIDDYLYIENYFYCLALIAIPISMLPSSPIYIMNHVLLCIVSTATINNLQKCLFHNQNRSHTKKQELIVIYKLKST